MTKKKEFAFYCDLCEKGATKNVEEVVKYWDVNIDGDYVECEDDVQISSAFYCDEHYKKEIENN